MGKQKCEQDQSLLDRIVAILLTLPWPDALTELWKIARKAVQRRLNRGMYEVLEYDSALDLRDRGGKRAIFRKQEKVRYLQDSIIAYQDQAWGDGEILLDYRCTPGTPVDRYRLGHKTYVLISRREVRNRGDIDEFNIEWKTRQGFLRSTEQWETHIKHPTERLKIAVLFPKSRPPHSAVLIESNRQRSHKLNDQIRRLPGSRWQVCWEMHKPYLHETYILQWEW